MKIVNVHFAPGFGSFFYDDQAAIGAGAEMDGFTYRGQPVTPGFGAIRLPAGSLGIGLELSDGMVFWGDMMGVQYSGAGGRDPLFDPVAAQNTVCEAIMPRLIGASVIGFRALADAVLTEGREQRLPLSIEYGVSQALLRAAAHQARITVAELVCREFGCPLYARAVPLYAQSGDARYVNVDKMILKRVDILPHGLINSPEKFGRHGEAVEQYVRWVARRVHLLGGREYRPVLHFDVYGQAGVAMGLNSEAIAGCIVRLADAAEPYEINIECPADYGSRNAQVEGYAAIRERLRARGCRARIVADERCNTLEDIQAFVVAKAVDLIQIKMPDVGTVADSIMAVLLCKAGGVGAYLGGSCTETELSAHVSVHVAVATQASMMLAKPGMGVDEAITITGNEQGRLLAQLRQREQLARGAR